MAIIKKEDGDILIQALKEAREKGDPISIIEMDYIYDPAKYVHVILSCEEFLI